MWNKNEETRLRGNASILGGIENKNDKAATQKLIAVAKLPCRPAEQTCECAFWDLQLD